ncbi:MAG: hypothetical protein CMP69_04120 [Flavobacteriales bacterium]|nr:hypothetical protein [Flavobacteriales bacterium]|tara:strand:+ start:3937 stop:4851 length:915 start_codon:yes stop_codon:yes gene_type:complete
MSNNKLDILNFKGDFDRAIYLQHKLNERVFSKTEIDVVYSDFTNWERNGLLDVINNHQKGSHKKLSYVDYVWVSIVKQLRGFGFSYDEIKSVKKTLFSNMFEDKELVKEFLSKKEYISKKSGMKINDLNKLDVNEINFQFIMIEFLMINIMGFAERTVIQCFKDNPEVVIPLSKNLIQDYQEVNVTDLFNRFIHKSHVCISLTDIMQNFIDQGEVAFESGYPSVLSKHEHNILKAIRHNYQDLKSINIRFKESKAQMLEIKMMKKVQVESRILELIKNGEYSTIEIKTVDGNISHYEKTEKIKL